MVGVRGPGTPFGLLRAQINVKNLVHPAVCVPNVYHVVPQTRYNLSLLKSNSTLSIQLFPSFL